MKIKVKPKRNSVLWIKDAGGNGIVINLNKQQKWDLIDKYENEYQIERKGVMLVLNKYTFDLNFELCSTSAIENGQT